MAHSQTGWLLVRQSRLVAEARGRAEQSGRQDKRGRHLLARNTSLHVGEERHGAASPPCCVRRATRADASMPVCFTRQDSPWPDEGTAMTDRRDDDFRIRPNAPKNRGKGFVSKVLKQVGKAA